MQARGQPEVVARLAVPKYYWAFVTHVLRYVDYVLFHFISICILCYYFLSLSNL